MEAAARWGVSRRRFNGWEPRRVTTTDHEYNDHGRLVRSVAVTVTEPEWDQDNRAWATALIEHERGLCGGCGHPLSVTTDPGMEGRYVRDGFVQCHRCVAGEQAHEAVSDNKFHPRALTYKHLIQALPPDPSLRQPDDWG